LTAHRILALCNGLSISCSSQEKQF
jgi:hypothetical protein